LPREL
ncbi:putative SLAIN motif-containing protein, partial [Naja naja]